MLKMTLYVSLKMTRSELRTDESMLTKAM